jgi:hypothetical protein
LALPEIQLDTIADEATRKAVVALLNALQQALTDIQTLRTENQALRDEIARLKGQPPRPRFPPAPGGSPPKPDVSSEKERKEPKSRDRSPRRLQVDREQVLLVDPTTLPPDAEFKGYEDKLVQDVLFCSDNVLFRRQKFYSPSQGRIFLAPLPAGYDGLFGPHLHAWLPVLYFDTNTSQPKLLQLLDTVGVQMSSGQIASLLLTAHLPFEAEHDRAYQAALRHCPWQHLDDTGTRLDGVGYYCHIVTSPVGCFYFTRPTKSRLTVIEVLRNESMGLFRLDAQALEWMTEAGVPASTCQTLAGHVSERSLFEPQFLQLLLDVAPWLSDPTDTKDAVAQKVWEACALSDYHQQKQMPVVKLLVTDDAPQFKGITVEQLLCWIHRGRNVKKLAPQVPLFQQEQKLVLGEFWGLYRQLRAWQKEPDEERTPALQDAFDAVVNRTVTYEDLGAQLQGMAEDKEALLMAALRHPEVPLHNNPAELPARGRARKRDVSYGPRTGAGAKAWDMWQSLLATAKKMGLNTYRYVLDRLTGAGEIPPLEKLIEQKAEDLGLGWTWGLRDAPSG